MRRVSVTDLKNRLSEYLRLVKRGETVEIMERSIPIARIEGISARQGKVESRLEILIREGLVARAEHAPDPRWLAPPPVPCRIDPVKVLLEDRDAR